MAIIDFDSENLAVDWISLNIKGLMDPRIIAGHLLKYFTPHILINDVPSIGFHGFKKKYKTEYKNWYSFNTNLSKLFHTAVFRL